MTCPVCGQANPPGARFCSSCGNRLPRTSSRPTRKLVTIVFSDVTGSTELAERLDPESLSQLMARWYARMRAVLEAHGGTVQKFIGDAVMAVFGIPVAHEDDAVRAVRAAAAMHEALEALNDELAADLGVGLSLRTGVQTGEVMAGNPALGDSLVVGDPVNVAARLEQAAEPGQILLGEVTRRLARDAVEVEPRVELSLKGKRRPVAAHPLRSVAPTTLGHARRHDTPLVGRSTELELLNWTWRRVVHTRTVQMVTVLGQAGVGKSRLAAEALGALDPPANVLTGRCLPYGEGITWWPVAEIVRQAAGITDADPPAEAKDKLSRLFNDGAERPEALAGSVARLVGLERGLVTHEDALWAVRRLLALLAGRNPLAVVLDDLHWAEPTLLDLIEQGVDNASRDVPLLVVCLARPELLETRPSWAGGKMNATTLLLEPLSAAESRTLLGRLAGGGFADEEVAEAIVSAAGGNPLFLEELFTSLTEDGRLVRTHAGWDAADDLPGITTPPSIQTLLTARLDRLDDGERAVLERASVIGQTFEHDAVLALSDDDEAVVAERLVSLTRRELLRPVPSRRPGEQAYEFRHLLLRDAVYDALPKAVRAELHERFATWLQDVLGARLDEYGEILGYHLEQAYRYRADVGPAAATEPRVAALATAASARLAEAGHRALARGDPHGAIKLLDRAGQLLPEDDPGRLRLLTDQAECHMAAWDYPAAKRALERAAKGAERVGDEGIQAYAQLGRLWVEHVGGDPDYDELRAQARNALTVFERLGDDRGAARAWYLLAGEALLRCQVAEGEEADRRALELAVRAGDERTVAGVKGGMALMAIWGPTPVAEGIERCEKLLAEAAGNRRVELAALGALAVLKAMDGEAEEARTLVRRASAIGHEFAVRQMAAQTSQFTGLALLLAGDAEEAEATLRWGNGVLEDMGDMAWRAELTADLSRVLWLRGRREGAEAFARISLELATPLDHYSRTQAGGILARALATKGELVAAETLAREAVATADGTDMLNMRGDAWADLAEVLALAGRFTEADKALAEAVRLYELKGNRVWAAAAKAKLGNKV